MIQSTYAEFMGLYPPSNPIPPNTSNNINSINDKMMPPMKVRNIVRIKAEKDIAE